MNRTHRIALLLLVLCLPLATVQLSASSDVPTGTTHVAETDAGVEIKVNSVPLHIALESIPATDSWSSVAIHPALQTRNEPISADILSRNWPNALDQLASQYNFAWRNHNGMLLLAPEGRLEEALAYRPDQPEPPRLSADIEVEVAGDTQSVDDLILSEGQWSGFLLKDIRFHVKPTLLEEELILLQFYLISDSGEKQTVGTPKIITRNQSEAVVRVNVDLPEGEDILYAIRVTPRLL